MASAAGCIAGTAFARADPQSKGVRSDTIIVTNPALAEALMALGVTRFGMPNVWMLRKNSTDFVLPDTVFDIGSITEPNLELLAGLRPRFILHYEHVAPDPKVLERVAPVILIPGRILEEQDALERLWTMLFMIADTIGASARAISFQRELTELFAETRHRLRGRNALPVLGVDITWSRIFAVWGKGSLLDGVLRELGLENAITIRDKPMGWVYLSFQQMLAVGDVQALFNGQIPEKTRNSPIWPMLPFVRDNRMTVFPKTNLYSGGILTAERLARNLGTALGG